MNDVAQPLTLHFDAAKPEDHPDAIAFLSQLTHELCQPLSTIESIAHYLRMVLPAEDERTQSQLARIQALVVSIGATLGDAVQYVQTHHCAAPPLIDLHELIAQTLAEKQSEGEAVSVRLELAEAPATVRLDPAQARHLMRSLLHMFGQIAGANLTLRTRTDGDRVALELAADGFEMPEAAVEALLEPFGRSAPPGSGLCLPSARRIVEAHGGRISARSESGRGLIVRNSFPKAG